MSKDLVDLSVRWLRAAAGLEARARRFPDDAELLRDMAIGAKRYAETVLQDDLDDSRRMRPWTAAEKALLLAFQRTNVAYLELAEAMAAGACPGDVPELIDATLVEIDAVHEAKVRVDGQPVC